MTGLPAFVDTHAHLIDEQFFGDAGAVIARSAQLGVRHIINVAFSERLWQPALDLSRAYPGVAYTLGIHPNDAGEWSNKSRTALLTHLSRQMPVAIGETGLDYYRDRDTRVDQVAAFEDQLDIASDFALPVVIHMRGDVEADIRGLLARRHDVMCVFHSFEGGLELCEWIVERGWMIGAGGLMSRRSAKTLRACLATVPIDQLLLETDSPYLAPTGWPEKRNSPESIPIVAGHLARLLEAPLEEVALRTTANADRVFGLSRWFDAAGQSISSRSADG